ncbi:MAG: hypothetical protein M1524_02775, partial [Patescibacteria group bacterium]|nr:hypothetical protein [Patescibacteria group bacterium]
MNKFIIVILGLIVVISAAMLGPFSINLSKQGDTIGTPKPSSFILRKEIDFTVNGPEYEGGNPEEKFLLAGADKDLTPKRNTMSKIGTVTIDGETKEVWRCHVYDYYSGRELAYIYVLKDLDKFIMDVYLSEKFWDKYPHDDSIVTSPELVPIEDVSVDFTVDLHGEEKVYVVTRERDKTPRKEIFSEASIYSLNPNPVAINKKIDDLGDFDVYEFKGDTVNISLYAIETGANILDGKSHEFYILSRITGPNGVIDQVNNKALQLKTFPFVKISERSWWLPDCKPAIYLYPEKETPVNVRIVPKGFFTITIPQYPLVDGWNVVAYPDGTIRENGKKYNYLYYEAKIENSKINKPADGFIVAFNNLNNFYDKLLTKLGLSENEINDFKDYWQKALPYSPYYFVGIMKDSDISKIEPMTIVPKPDTIIRVRLYFEPRENTIEIEAPD